MNENETGKILSVISDASFCSVGSPIPFWFLTGKPSITRILSKIKLIFPDRETHSAYESGRIKNGSPVWKDTYVYVKLCTDQD